MLPANLSVLLHALNSSSEALGPFAEALRLELEKMNQDNTLSSHFADNPMYAASAGPTTPAGYCIMCGKKK